MGAVLNLMQPGGGGGMAWPPTAEEVYALTRPADWLALPQPAPGEVYMLALIPAEGSALLAFTVECTGNWTAAVGTVSGGAFVPTESAALASGAVWESELAAADFGGVTEEGFAQAVVKLSGAGITAVAPAAHSARSNFTAWGVAEISCLLPDGAEFRCGGTTARTALAALRYFSGGGGKLKGNFASGSATLGAFQMCQSLVCAMGVGTAGQTDLSGMFSGCTSLLAVSGLDCSSALDVSNMFMNCVSLPAAPELDLSSAETLAGLFRGCEALRSAGDISAPLAASAQNMFTSCLTLRAVGGLDIPAATTLAAAFQGCTALERVGRLGLAALTNANAAFTNCAALGSVRLDPEAAGWAGASLSLANCGMGHAALAALLASLPAVTAGTLTLTGNYGAGELSEAEIAAAEARGWTVST